MHAIFHELSLQARATVYILWTRALNCSPCATPLTYIRAPTKWEQGVKWDPVGPGGMRVEVLINQNGGVV